MNMFENLRSLPEHKRKQLAFGFALLVTILIFSFWASSLGKMFDQTGVQATAVEASSGEPSPATAFIQSFTSLFNSAGEAIKEVVGSIEVGI